MVETENSKGFSKTCYYELLGVDRKATTKDIARVSSELVHFLTSIFNDVMIRPIKKPHSNGILTRTRIKTRQQSSKLSKRRIRLFQTTRSALGTILIVIRSCVARMLVMGLLRMTAATSQRLS